MPLPQPRLLLPRYTPQDIFHVFSMFLDEQEFTYTSSVLAKELVARGFAAPSDDAEDDPIDADSLREHLAFVVAKLDAETEAEPHPETSDRHVSENLRDDARDGECRPVDRVPRVDGDGERDGDDGKRDATPRGEPRSAPEKRREDAGEIEPAYVTNAETRRTDRDEDRDQDRDDEKEKDEDANDGDARERRDVFAADDDDHAVDDILAESTDLDLPAVTEECGAATATAATSTGEDEGETVDGVARENRDASAAATNERRRTTNTPRGLPRRSRLGPGAGRGGRGGVRPSGGRGAGGVAGAGASGGRGGRGGGRGAGDFGSVGAGGAGVAVVVGPPQTSHPQSSHPPHPTHASNATHPPQRPPLPAGPPPPGAAIRAPPPRDLFFPPASDPGWGPGRRAAPTHQPTRGSGPGGGGSGAESKPPARTHRGNGGDRGGRGDARDGTSAPPGRGRGQGPGRGGLKRKAPMTTTKAPY